MFSILFEVVEFNKRKSKISDEKMVETHLVFQMSV